MDNQLACLPPLQIAKIFQIFGFFDYKTRCDFQDVMTEIQPFLCDKILFSLLFLTILLDDDASRDFQKTCQYLAQKKLGATFKGQNGEETFCFMNTKIIQITKYLALAAPPPPPQKIM